jgi:hypothetical protein
MLSIALGGNVAAPHRLGREWDAPRSIGVRCWNSSLRPNEMSELLAAGGWSGMLLIGSERNERRLFTPSEANGDPPQGIGRKGQDPHRAPMRCQNSSLRPNGMGCTPSQRSEMRQRSPPREEMGCPQSIERKCRNPSPRPNEVLELLTASERNGMLPIASEGNVATPHRLGRKWTPFTAWE